MIYPRKGLELFVLLIGLPCTIAATLIPEIRTPLLYIVLPLIIVVVVDAIGCLLFPRTVTISVPSELRLYRGVDCQVVIVIKGQRRLSGKVLDSANAKFIIEAGIPFSLTGSDLSSNCTIVIVPLLRGGHELSTLLVRINSSWKMWYYIGEKPVLAKLHVFANNKSDLHLLNMLQSGEAAGGHVQPVVGKGREVDRLRDYVSGDSMGDIHWKAMARHGHPIIKEYRIERSQTIYLVIDTSRSSKRIVEYQDMGTIKEKLPVPLIERSIVTADILSMVASKQSDRFGLIGFDNKVKLFINPDSGSHHLMMCRKALVNLESSSSPADYREMFQFLATNIHRRAMILILADFEDPFASESFAAHVQVLTKKHVVLGVCPVSENVQPLFCARVESDDQIYGALSGHCKWQGIRSLQQSIRAKGAEIIIASHRDLASRTIDAYFKMKRCQRL